MGAVKIIYGGAGLRPEWGVDAQTVNDIVDVMVEHGIDVYDTARIYGGNEGLLGETGTPKRMTIDTKVVGGFNPRGLAVDKVKEDFETSLRELKVDKVSSTVALLASALTLLSLLTLGNYRSTGCTSTLPMPRPTWPTTSA